MGGYVAEELTIGEVTTGASNDIERATALARKMVCEYGMSTHLGPVAFGRREEKMFLGRDLGESRDYGPDTAREIDAEIRKFMAEALGKAREFLTTNRDRLIAVSEALIKSETIEGEDLERLFALPTPKVLPFRGNVPLPNAVGASELGESKTGGDLTRTA